FRNGKLGGSFRSRLFLGLVHSTTPAISCFLDKAKMDSTVAYSPAAWACPSMIISRFSFRQNYFPRNSMALFQASARAYAFPLNVPPVESTNLGAILTELMLTGIT